MADHNHHYHELEYCQECDVVYCHCGKEWGVKAYIPYTTTTAAVNPTYTFSGTAGGYWAE